MINYILPNLWSEKDLKFVYTKEKTKPQPHDRHQANDVSSCFYMFWQPWVAKTKKPRKSGELLRGQKINNMKHKNCAPFRTWTWDPLINSQMLWPTELRRLHYVTELSVLRLQKYGFFHYWQVFSKDFFQLIYNLLIFNKKFFILPHRIISYLCTN